MPLTSRRTVFRALGLAPFAAAVTTSAHGLTFEQPAKSVEGLYAAGRSCGQQTDYHATLLADAEALIDGRQLPEPDRARMVADVRCPLCGCAVSDS